MKGKGDITGHLPQQAELFVIDDHPSWRLNPDESVVLSAAFEGTDHARLGAPKVGAERPHHRAFLTIAARTKNRNGSMRPKCILAAGGNEPIQKSLSELCERIVEALLGHDPIQLPRRVDEERPCRRITAAFNQLLAAQRQKPMGVLLPDDELIDVAYPSEHPSEVLYLLQAVSVLPPNRCLAELPPNRLSKPGKRSFQEVVVRPGSHGSHGHFLAHGSGNDDEGNVYGRRLQHT